VGPVNLGNPVEHSILGLDRLIIDLTGSTSEIIYKPLPQDDPFQRQPDISLARGELHWEPKVHIEEGLMKNIDYFRSIAV
jgi:UDP-glucuronate decarboxylase